LSQSGIDSIFDDRCTEFLLAVEFLQGVRIVSKYECKHTIKKSDIFQHEMCRFFIHS